MQILASVADINPPLLEKMSRLGIGLELSFFSLPENLAPHSLETHLQRYESLLSDFTLPVTMHGAFYDLNICAREPKIGQVAAERIRESLEIAHRLGIDRIVFHPNFKQAQSRPNWKAMWVEQQLLFWAEMAKIARDFGQTILLENTSEPDYTYLWEILDGLKHDAVRACLDTGHTRCFTQTKLPILDWAKGLGKYLTYIHLHTNRGQHDDHLAFNHPEGVIDFEPFFAYIRQMPTPPTINIEVKTVADFEQSVSGLGIFAK